MGSKPKIVQPEDPAIVEQRAKDLAAQEANAEMATRRKNKSSTVLSSLGTNEASGTALSKSNLGN